MNALDKLIGTMVTVDSFYKTRSSIGMEIKGDGMIAAASTNPMASNLYDAILITVRMNDTGEFVTMPIDAARSKQ